MRLKRTLNWGIVLGVFFLAVQAGAADPPVLKTQTDRMSYGLGVDAGRNLKRQQIEVDAGVAIRAMRDVLSSQKLLFTEEDLGLAMTAFQVELGQRATYAKMVPEKVSYGIGFDVARVLKRHALKVNLDLVTKGFKDALSGEKLLMKEKDLPVAMAVFQLRVRQNPARGDRLARDNKRQKESLFLAQNKTKEGVVTRPSGLQYKILKAGEGKKPGDTDTVQVHYRGTFIDGTEFDSSYRSGKPVTIKVAETIPGWEEALKLMSVGSRGQLFVPPQLAYKSRGWGLADWSASTFIFELELISVN